MVFRKGFVVEPAFIRVDRAATAVTAKCNVALGESVIKCRKAKVFSVIGRESGIETVVRAAVELFGTVWIIRVTECEHLVRKCCGPNTEHAFQGCSSRLQVGISKPRVPLTPYAKAPQINQSHWPFAAKVLAHSSQKC